MGKIESWNEILSCTICGAQVCFAEASTLTVVEGELVIQDPYKSGYWCDCGEVTEEEVKECISNLKQGDV